jgi:hypothetical protein
MRKVMASFERDLILLIFLQMPEVTMVDLGGDVRFKTNVL